MRITDAGMTVDLDEDDPRVSRIRAVLFGQVGDRDPVRALWDACLDPHREVLAAISEHGEVSQALLESALGISAEALRGRHGGLAKIAKRIGVEYPIVSTGTRREARRFSLDPDFARQILKFVHQGPKGRSK